MKRKHFFFGTVALILLFSSYVMYVNRNSKNMTIRQKILKAVYPALMALSGKKAKSFGNQTTPSPVSFYSLQTTANSGRLFNFSALQGKKVLIVNTASDCGYTNQYDELQKLYETYSDKLVIIGFPANDFKEQEKGSDEEIAQFCKVNYGVTFPLMKKSTVVKSPDQNPVYKWLSDSTQNGWCNKQPSWNFSKYLLDEHGNLLQYYDPAVSPLSREVTDRIIQ